MDSLERVVSQICLDIIESGLEDVDDLINDSNFACSKINKFNKNLVFLKEKNTFGP